MAAEAAISTVVQLLGDMLIQKVNFLRGVEGDAQLLIDELNRMQSFLRYANKRKSEDDRVRNWISDIRELALDAEDAIEMFDLNVKNVRKRSFAIRDLIPFPSHVSHLNSIGEEIKSIRAKLDAIDKSCERYGIKDLEESREARGRSEVEAMRRLAPWEKNDHLVGVDGDLKKLLEPIMDEEKKGLSVVAVVGMGGIGKSTLAREVYNHPDVVFGRFDCRAWVVVSSEFNLLETIKQLLLETTRSEQEKRKLLDRIQKLEESMSDGLYLERKLQELLHIRLQGKTYFIVLDDVWKKEHWNLLMTAFPKEQDKTSRLLLTTREDIDIMNHSQSLHKLRFLDLEKSWKLFVKKVLPENSNGEFPNELEQIGRDIVKKCNGLPLSITVMGGLLAQTRCSRDWEEALDELNSNLGRAKNCVLSIVELSYHHLSQQLKSCFLCLAFFKEDDAIPVKRLLSIMVGQRLIQKTGRTTAEEIARGYLDELISRNMVQVKDLTLDNRVKSCHLHDSLRMICLEKAEEEIGLKFLKRDSGISWRKRRHCVVQCDDLTSLQIDQNKHIRSLFVLNVEDDSVEVKPDYWKSFQHLKILDLEGYYRLKRLPESFKLLPGLKQFRIGRQSIKKSRKSFYTDFYKKLYTPLKLPSWLDSLQKLELLDIRTEAVEFPKFAPEMDSLRHIHASRIYGSMSMHSLKKVETLKYIRLEDWIQSSSKVMDGCNVRALGIFVYDDDDGSSSKHEPSRVRGSLDKLENLVELCLLWDYRLSIDPIIIPPLSNLTKIKLRGRISKSLTASTLPPNLSHLTLERSCLDEDPMLELGKLPKLSYLKLKFQSYLGMKLRVSRDGFPRLRGLCLQRLRKLRNVVIREGGMPQLKLLQVDDCSVLDTKNLSNKSYQLQIMTDSI